MAQRNNQKGKRVPAYTSDRMVAHLIVGLLLVALGVMIFLANALGMSGDVFDSLRQVSRGLCGMIALEDGAFRGVYILTDALTEDFDHSVVQGIRADRLNFWGLCTGETTIDM